MERLKLGRKESLVFLLALLLFVTGLAYPQISRYQRLARIEELLFEDDFTAADKLLSDYLNHHPSDGDAWLLSAVVARRSELVSEFAERLRTASQLGIAADAIAFQQQLLETQRGKIDKQAERELLDVAAQLTSDFAAAQTYEAIARGYLATYRLRESWGCIEHWLRWRPGSLSAQFLRAEIILRTQGAAGVIDTYRQILKMNPHSQVAQEKLAVNLLSINEVDEAASILRDLSVVAADKPQVWIDLAEAERRLGNVKETTKAVERAVVLGLNDMQRARVSAILGQIQLVEQQPEAAIANLLVTIELTPEDAAAHHALGTALGFLGENELATKHREAAQRIRESYAEVNKLTQQVIDDPNNPQIRMQIGEAFLAQGMTKEGIGWIKTALDRDANFEPARRFLSTLPSTPRMPTNANTLSGPQRGDE